MAKAAKPKAKPSRKDQYQRFQQSARVLGVDDEESARTFERAFGKIVPTKTFSDSSKRKASGRSPKSS
jgi:hypothetical protein